MRIEILIGNDDPIIYPLNKPKITLGTSENCDIVLASDGLSRKHLMILSEDDNYYVIDQGSTNGSFMNEERLIPGKRVEFTSFFPVRLGDQVLVSLLGDEEGETGIEIPVTYREKSSPNIKVEDTSDRTSVISLSELNKVKTENLVLQRNQKRAEFKKKDKKAPPPKKKNINILPYLLITLVVGVGYYNYQNVKSEEPDTPVAVIGKIEPLKEDQVKAKPEEMPFLIAESDVPAKEAVAEYLNSLKCTTDIEQKFCDYFPHARDVGYGVVQSGLTLYVLINGTWFFEEAKKFSKPPVDDSPVSIENHNKLLNEVAVYLYLMRLSPEIDISELKDMKIVIGLFKEENEGRRLIRAVAMKPEVLLKLKEFVFNENLRFTKSNGLTALTVTKPFYRTF